MRGDLLASGRDADIFDDGPGRVVRRSREGRSLAYEADVMSLVRAAGYPAPEVYELRSGETEIVMERLDGPSLMQVIGATPWHLRRHARLLARLHRDLGAIEAPERIRQLEGGGTRFVHLDLHPLNVILTAHGPCVIDWPNARRGRPEVDVASTWAILAVSEIPGAGLTRAAGLLGRRLLLRSFLSATGLLERARAELPGVIEARIADRNVTETEVRRLRAWMRALHAGAGADAGG